MEYETGIRIEDILARTDHTLLRPSSVWDEIKAACDDAIRYRWCHKEADIEEHAL